MAQLLFTTAIFYKGIQAKVSFLTTIVIEPDKYHWGELVRVLVYLRSTIQMRLMLRIDLMNVFKWKVDASFAAHKDVKVKNGANVSNGVGFNH